MAIDGENKAGVARDGNKAESVSCALFNVHNSKRNVRGATRKATLAVDQSGVESRDRGSIGRKIMIPIRECDDSIIVVNIIQIFMRVIRIIYNQGTTQAITVLSLEMAVIPIGARLVQRIEIIQEALVWYEGALGDEGRAVDEIRALLEDTVEMDRGAQVHGFVLQFIDDVDRELGTLRPSDYWTRESAPGKGSRAREPIRCYLVVHDLDGSTRSDRSRDAPTNSGKKQSKGAKPRHS